MEWPGYRANHLLRITRFSVVVFLAVAFVCSDAFALMRVPLPDICDRSMALRGLSKGSPQIAIIIYVRVALLRERELPHDFVPVPNLSVSVYLSLLFSVSIQSCAPALPNHPSGLSVSSFCLPPSLSALPSARATLSAAHSTHTGRSGRPSNALVF